MVAAMVVAVHAALQGSRDRCHGGGLRSLRTLSPLGQRQGNAADEGLARQPALYYGGQQGS